MNLSTSYWYDHINIVNIIVILGICFAIYLLGTLVESRLDRIESNCPHIQEVLNEPR